MAQPSPCSSCQYYRNERIVYGVRIGECHRYPPQNNQGLYPLTYAEELSCGEQKN